MSARTLLLACAATAGLFGLAGCATDGGYGYGYGYDYYGPEYYGPAYFGSDFDFDDGFFGPEYYVGPGDFDRHDHRHGDDHPFRSAPDGRAPPSLPRARPPAGLHPGAGGFHGGGVRRGGGERGERGDRDDRGPRGH